MEPVITSALRELRKHQVPFTEHEYRYEERGGTRVASRQLGVDEHAVVKTLVMEDDARSPLLVLMHGDREVSTKTARAPDRPQDDRPCEPDAAQRHTGYRSAARRRSGREGVAGLHRAIDPRADRRSTSTAGAAGCSSGSIRPSSLACSARSRWMPPSRSNRAELVDSLADAITRRTCRASARTCRRTPSSTFCRRQLTSPTAGGWFRRRCG